MFATLQRLFELLFWSGVLSFTSCMLYLYQFFYASEANFAIVLMIAFLIFVIAQVFQLRRCYYELHSPLAYYLSNYAAYALFILVSVAVNFWIGDVAYGWVFNIFKVLRFAKTQWPIFEASAASHLLMLVIIAIAPIGMGRIFDFDDIRPELMEEYLEDEEEEDFDGEEN